MSDKYTTVRVPVGEGGFCCLGYVTREKAIAVIRSHAEHDKADPTQPIQDEASGRATGTDSIESDGSAADRIITAS